MLCSWADTFLSQSSLLIHPGVNTGETLHRTSIPSVGSRNTTRLFMLLEAELSADLIGYLARMNTSPLPSLRYVMSTKLFRGVKHKAI